MGVNEPQIDAERLRRLQSVTDAALAHLDLETLLAELLVRTCEVLQVDTCAALLLDGDTNELVARAAVGIEEEVEQGIRIPVGAGFAGTIAARKEPVILPDVDHAFVLNPILREKGIKSMLGVPLLVGGEVLGVLHVGSLTHRTFTNANVELLQLVADRAALAIEHARLYAAERQARVRIENVQAVTDAALAHLEVDELLSVLLPRIRGILHADTCAVLLLDAERQELVARAALGIEEEVEQGVRVPLGKGFAGRVAQSQQPIVLPDLAQADVWNPILRQKGITSMAGVPLLIGGRATGVLHVGSLERRNFTTNDVELLQLVADRVAIALERARIHEETVLLDRLKLNFVAVASHELRTPATAVYGALETVFSRPELDPETREELLRTAYEQSDRLRLLLEQLLDLSRLDERRIAVHARPTALHAELRQFASHVMPAGMELELDVDESLAANVDPLVLERVITNLLTNAVRYGSPPVVLRAEESDTFLRISVEDHGTGVSPELAPHIFERFARGSEAAGTGLGLAIARAYARAHGGDLLYAPTSSGSRFELVIPRT
jgi:signal transduction histidine kinase